MNIKDNRTFHALVVEDNPGDFFLVKEYLSEQMEAPVLHHAPSFLKAKDFLSKNKKNLDVILLDLSLPDHQGEQLIRDFLILAPEIPIIVFTGRSDIEFAMKALAFGISDYILKDHLNPIVLYKSIIYSMERFKNVSELKKSEQKYTELFQLCPIPMWVYDLETLRFLNVNEAAIRQYGYSLGEFLNMTIRDIRPEEDIPLLEEAVSLSSGKNCFYFEGEFRHQRKNGEIIHVMITSNIINYMGRRAEIILANDITEKKEQIIEIEDQNDKLREIAWVQSHILRAPLARLLWFVQLLMEEPVSTNSPECKELINTIQVSATELDSVIREIVKKSQQNGIAYPDS